MKPHWMKRVLTLFCTLAMLVAFTGCAEVLNTALDIAIDATAPSTSQSESDAANAAPTAEPDISPTAGPSSAPAAAPAQSEAIPGEDAGTDAPIDRDGVYTSKEDVALYLHTYGELPNNFITKKEAEALGWPGGDLRPYAPGKCIGGSHFGNYEGQLPEKDGRTYQECDIDTLDASRRGAKRIIYSNDGLIYYTGDHYETFELLYGEE